MTVGELKDLLGDYDQSLPIVVVDEGLEVAFILGLDHHVTVENALRVGVVIDEQIRVS